MNSILKVTINKETGLGRPEHSRENYLPVISQSGEILTEGTWECEKVWQFYNEPGKYWTDCSERASELYCSGKQTRQVYRIVLPTQPDVKKVVKTKEEIAKEILYSQVTNGQHHESLINGEKLIQQYADQEISAYKQQVFEAIEKVYCDKDGLVSLDMVIEAINNV